MDCDEKGVAFLYFRGLRIVEERKIYYNTKERKYGKKLKMAKSFHAPKSTSRA